MLDNNLGWGEVRRSEWGINEKRPTINCMSNRQMRVIIDVSLLCLFSIK